MPINEIVETVTSGSLLLAIPLAFAAGLVSFLSPCVLPLVPGYLSFITGVAGARATAQRTSVSRSRAVWGSLVFVSGFSVVFISYGALFGGIGQLLLEYQRTIQMIMGVVVVILGLGFLGAIPAIQRDIRIHRVPTGTLFGAFLLGALFAIGWTPCIGPTLAAVQGMALNEASAVRGAILSAAYCLGLGLPFVFIALFFERSIRIVKILRRHSRGIMHFGGVMLIVIGLLLVTGYWNDLTVGLRVWAADWGVPI
jgi:cytochrome c-type biogenesis protein